MSLTDRMRSRRLWPWLVGGPLTVLVVYVLAEPYIPHERTITSADPEIVKKVEEVIAANGYHSHTEAAKNGEQRVVLDKISTHAYRPIECSVWRWEIEREKKREVVVLNRHPECVN